MMSKLKRIVPSLFILPAVVINLVFFVYPFIQSLVMSFHDWPILGKRTFIGFENFANVFADEMFWKSLWFTVKYALLVTPSLFILAFALALLINKSVRGRNIFRSVYFAPVVISMSTCSLIWLWMYNDLYGILNHLMMRIGLIHEPILWMSNAATSLPAVVIMITWKMAGFSMLIILAALQGVDEQVYEAAGIDGSGKVNTFFQITLPIIRPQVGLALILSVIGSVLAFEQFTIMTKGGPMRSTTTIVSYIYETSFRQFKLGYGSALAMVLLIILLGLSYFQFKLLRDPSS